MINFLYCFDENYNTPAMCSIYSLLENVDEKIVINIMHKSEDNHDSIPKKILKHRMLYKLNIHKVNLSGNTFPNIDGTHVSEATYYRLFLEEYLSDDIRNLVYLDCDVICVNNPLNLIKNELNEISKSEKIVGVLPEIGMQRYGSEKFKLTNNYFNAGVMLIDYGKWKSKNLLKDFLKNINKYSNEIDYWDQDILNIQFNNSYKAISKYLNYKIDMDDNEFSNLMTKEGVLNDVCFFHYSGKFKPWSIKGALNLNAEYFQSIYRQLYLKKYFFLFNYKVNALRDLLYGVVGLQIFKAKFPLSFFISAFKKII